MVKLRHIFLLPSEGEVIEDAYIWGAELIHAIRDHHWSQIVSLELSAEITYMQGKLFAPFVSELWTKYCASTDRCQKDILEMLMDSFHTKFTQKHFSQQHVVHVNDLVLMRQTVLQPGEEGIKRLYEIKHPYYFIEYYPRGSDQL